MRREDIEQLSDGIPESVAGSGGGLSEQRLESGEGLLDRVEVWGVGRRVQELAPTALNASRTLPTLWLERLSITTTSLRLSEGARNCVR